MFKPSREQARQLFFDTWRKYHQREVLSGIETIALEVILQHPEYHPIMAGMTANLSAADIENLAFYYSSQPGTLNSNK